MDPMTYCFHWGSAGGIVDLLLTKSTARFILLNSWNEWKGQLFQLSSDDVKKTVMNKFDN